MVFNLQCRHQFRNKTCVFFSSLRQCDFCRVDIDVKLAV